MRLYVFGVNVDYSLFLVMYNVVFKVCGIFYYYELYLISNILSFEKFVSDLYFVGVLVGLFFKVEIISLMYFLS